jgi:long-subunit acyl-CoA synthetase (AMP-forming)
MFTSGSTATPKAVPLTHGGLLWNCEQRQLVSPDLVAASNASTLSFLPNFHVIGFVNNFLFNLCAARPQALTAPVPAPKHRAHMPHASAQHALRLFY